MWRAPALGRRQDGNGRCVRWPLVSRLQRALARQTQTTHAMINTPIATASAIVLAGLIVFALGSKYLANIKQKTLATR